MTVMFIWWQTVHIIGVWLCSNPHQLCLPSLFFLLLPARTCDRQSRSLNWARWPIFTTARPVSRFVPFARDVGKRFTVLTTWETFLTPSGSSLLRVAMPRSDYYCMPSWHVVATKFSFAKIRFPHPSKCDHTIADQNSTRKLSLWKWK